MIRRTDHDYRRGNQWNYVSWAVIVALFAILSAFIYLKFHEDRRVDGITDALAAMCETTEPERMGKCFKELLSNRANSGTFQQFHLDELKEKVKNLEASLGYPAPDSGEFRELSERLDEVTEQQKEISSLLEKTKTDVSHFRTELTELDQRMNEINEFKTTVNEKQLQADHDRLRNELNEVKEKMARQDNTLSGLQSSLDILSRDHNNVTVWMDRQDNTVSGLQSHLDTLSRDHNNVTVWMDRQDNTLSGLQSSLGRNHNNATMWMDRDQSLLLLLVLVAYVWMWALTMCVKQKSAARSSPYDPETQHFNRAPHRPDQLSSSQPYRSREAARRPATDVCVVGFYTETSRTHLKSVRDICTASATGLQVRVEVTGCTVHRHEDLGSIPGAKVYVMFVDFNETNAIQEDPRKGLGDLQLPTVRSLWGLGGDVILVYTGDLGSKGLEENELFNYGLTSINHHAELSKLKNQQRMLSVHKTFTPYQRNHIKDIVAAKCV